MPRFFVCTVLLVLAASSSSADSFTPAKPVTVTAAPALRYESRVLRGWSVMIRGELLTDEKRAETEKGLVLIGKQLEDIERLVPA
jgi:lipoprotein NlpI